MAYELPDILLHTTVQRSQRFGEYMREVDFEHNSTLSDAVDWIDENTVAVLALALGQGLVFDVSKDAARVWLDRFRASIHKDPDGPVHVPPIVKDHLQAELDELLDAYGRYEAIQRKDAAA